MVRLTAVIGVLALLAQALLVVTDVLMRWLLASPILGVMDICQLLNVVAIASFIPFVVFERRNVEIHFFSRARFARLTAWSESFASLCTLLFLSIALWQCARYASQVAEQVTPILEIPIAPVWWLGCGLFSVCLPAQLAICLWGGPRSEAGEGPPAHGGRA